MADEIKEKTGLFGDKYKEVYKDDKLVARIDTETNILGEKVDVTRDMSTLSYSSPIISTETHKKTPGGDEIIEKRDDEGKLITRARDEGLFGDKEVVARDPAGSLVERKQFSDAILGQELITTYDPRGNVKSKELRSKPHIPETRTDDGGGRSDSSTGPSAAISRIWRRKFPKTTFLFIAWTGASWLVQQWCNQALGAVTQYSFAWWLIEVVWLACWPGVIVGGLALLIIIFVFLIVVLVIQKVIWLVNYFIQHPY